MKKKILITGSTDGIGKIAAKKLAQDGHEIYLHGRNANKLNAVIAELKETTGNTQIGGFVADFSDLTAVQQMAETIKNELTQLDVLINNAGVFKSSVAQTNDGFDIRFAVNYFAPYLLTQELLPLLKKSTEPRLINLSSAAQSSVAASALGGEQQIGAQSAYAQSKLALTMWSFALAEKEQTVTVIPVNPGSLLNTNMVREAYGKFWSSADKGADILYDLAISDEYANSTGQYFDNDRGAFGEAHPDAYDTAKIDHLLILTEQLLSRLTDLRRLDN